MILKIHQNIWGNWNLYSGTKKIKEIGASEFEAKRILKEEANKRNYKMLSDYKAIRKEK